MKRFLAAMLGCVLALAVQADEWMVRHRIKGSFEDARDAVVAAIEGRGLVINYTSHIGDMLERTGRDLGATRKIYANAEIIEFCSAKLSRQMMEADPHNIVLCPFAIAVYALPDEKDAVWVAYRKPPAKSGKDVTDMLEGIVGEARR